MFSFGINREVAAQSLLLRNRSAIVKLKSRFTFASLTIILCIATATFARTLAAAVRVDVVLGTAATAPSVFYVDPVNGSRDGDGSRLKPWRTFAEVVGGKLINGQDPTKGVVHAGDIIYLLTGNHGSVTINPYMGALNNTSPITVQAFPNNKPVLNQLTVRSVSNWTFRGLTFEPASRADGVAIGTWFTLVTLDQVESIIFDKNTLYSQLDVTAWTSDDWTNQSVCRGILFNGKVGTITNNVIRNVRNGITVGGNYVNVTGNTIDYFTDDAIDFTSSNTVIRGNVITNHYGFLANGVHNDGIQGWTVGGVPNNNVLIDRNLIIASTGEYSTIPAQGTGEGDDLLQGIAIFDGTWKDVVITNNVLVVPAYHVISMYGVNNLKIQNNTALSSCSNPKIVGWIGVFNKKDGTVPTNVTVRNNIANTLNLSAKGVISDHNLLLVPRKGGADLTADPLDLFVSFQPDVPFFDLHLPSGSPAIGAGGLPMLTQDKDGKARITNDIGAYAY